MLLPSLAAVDSATVHLHSATWLLPVFGSCCVIEWLTLGLSGERSTTRKTQKTTHVSALQRFIVSCSQVLMWFLCCLVHGKSHCANSHAIQCHNIVTHAGIAAGLNRAFSSVCESVCLSSFFYLLHCVLMRLTVVTLRETIVICLQCFGTVDSEHQAYKKNWVMRC